MAKHELSKSVSNIHFSKILINGHEVNPHNVLSINIYEGLTSPALTGRIYIADREAILEVHETFPGDSIEIEFTSKADRTNAFRFKGLIVSNDGTNTHADQTFPSLCLQFCSEWWFNASTKQISKCYKNESLNDIFYDIIENECNGVFNGFQPKLTTKIERLVTPYWSPAHILKWLLGWAFEEDSGYVIYENFLLSSLVQCDSLNTIFSIASNPDNRNQNDIIMSSQNPFYVGTTNTFYVESLSNSMRYLNQGMYQTDSFSFDYDKSKIQKVSKTSDKVNFNHLRPLLPLKKDFTTEKYKSVTHTWGPSPVQSKINTDRDFTNVMEGLLDTNYINIFSDMVKVNSLLPGDTGRRCGQGVKINFPSINTKSDIKARHKFLEGVYVIRNIQHIFQTDTYKQAITFVNDGIGQLSRTDIKEW